MGWYGAPTARVDFAYDQGCCNCEPTTHTAGIPDPSDRKEEAPILLNGGKKWNSYIEKKTD